MSCRKTVVFTTSFHVAPTVAEHRGEVRHHALGLRGDVAGDDLPGRGIDRDLAGGEQEAIGDDALRVRADGGGRLVRVHDLQAHDRFELASEVDDIGRGSKNRDVAVRARVSGVAERRSAIDAARRGERARR